VVAAIAVSLLALVGLLGLVESRSRSRPERAKAPARKPKPTGSAGLKFPSGRGPATVHLEVEGIDYLSHGETADEALAEVAIRVYRVHRQQGASVDEARELAWRAVQGLVDQHTYELEDQGDAVAAMLDAVIEEERMKG
jgi:hypothetical protein